MRLMFDFCVVVLFLLYKVRIRRNILLRQILSVCSEFVCDYARMILDSSNEIVHILIVLDFKFKKIEKSLWFFFCYTKIITLLDLGEWRITLC
jgi:hypothetical protein